MEKPPVRKASRALNLAKPAPRKNGLNKDPVTVVTEEAIIENTMIESERNDKENRNVGKRASRGLKLEKPAPLKSSRIYKSQDGNSGLSDITPIKQKDVGKSQTEVEREGNIPMTKQPAEMKADLLISEALADLEGARENLKPPTSMQRKTRLLSQVSDDSGLGDMSFPYSRQGSMLESLTENQDDLDWDDVDNSAVTTFIFGNEHLKCLATTVNQIQPFNSLLTDNITQGQALSQTANPSMKDKRARKLSHQNEHTVNKKANLSRSYSVPSTISYSKEAEFWDDELDYPVNDMAKVETDKSYQNQYIPKSDRMRSLSAQNSRVDLEKDNVRRFNNTCQGNSLTEKDFAVISTKGKQHSAPDVFNNSTKSFSEDWESEVINIEPCKYLESDNMRPCTPVNVINHCEDDTYSAIRYKGTDPDYTPKAGSVLPKFGDLNSAVKQKLSNNESFRKCQIDSAEPLGKSHQSDGAAIFETCDIPSAMMKNLPSYRDYRDKKDTDLSSSTTDTDDQISSSISDESFNEQMYAWELIEDLSDRVNSLKLNQEKPDEDMGNAKKEKAETYDITDEIPPKFVALPEDLEIIEAELEFMREDLDLSESIKPDKTKNVNSVLKMARSEHAAKGLVVVIREPLSPYSPEDEIWRAEEGMHADFSAVKERRGMFRYYRQSQNNDDVSESLAIIQYSAQELLKLGTSMLSKKKPDSWPYLETIYPTICLEKVSSYFDCERYSKERGYVAEVFCVRGENKKNSSNTGARRNTSGFPDVSRPPPPTLTKGGFGAPRSGFGVPVKASASEESCQDSQEKRFVQHQRSSTPVKFENDFETDGVSVSNAMQAQKSYNEHVEFGNIQLQNNEVNLDRKCDVSVRNEGSLRLFEAATNKILPIKSARESGVKRSISDPEGDRLTLGRTVDEKLDIPVFRRSTSYRVHHCNEDHDFLLNKDLPEVCPW